MVGQGVDEHDSVLARFHYLIQVANAAALNSPGKRAVHPSCGVALEQVFAHQVAGGQILVTGYGNKRYAVVVPAGTCAPVLLLAHAVGHVLEETGLAAARRALEQYRDSLSVSGLKEGHLVLERQVEGLLCDVVFLDDMGLVIMSLSFERHGSTPAV